MKYINSVLVWVVLLTFLGCSKDSDVQPSPPIFTPEPFENNLTSFSFPEFDLQINDTTSICSNPLDLERELTSGPDFHLRTGFSYNNLTPDLKLFKVLLNVRGFVDLGGDPTAPSSVPFELVTDICESYPEQCVVSILVKWQETYYRSLSYTPTPYEVIFLDENSTYNHSFIEISEEDRILRCFDNNEVRPMRLEYDGYLYNNELTDSIRIEDLVCDFTILTF